MVVVVVQFLLVLLVLHPSLAQLEVEPPLLMLLNLELVPLLNEQMVLCVSTEHPWSHRRRIDINDLQDSPMVVYESGYFIRSKLDQLCADRSVQPDFRMQSNFLPLLLKMVKQGMGTTVGLKIMSEEEPGIVGIPLSPKTEVSMALAKRRGRTISRANQAFLDWAVTIPGDRAKQVIGAEI